MNDTLLCAYLYTNISKYTLKKKKKKKKKKTIFIVALIYRVSGGLSFFSGNDCTKNTQEHLSLSLSLSLSVCSFFNINVFILNLRLQQILMSVDPGLHCLSLIQQISRHINIYAQCMHRLDCAYIHCMMKPRDSSLITFKTLSKFIAGVILRLKIRFDISCESSASRNEMPNLIFSE